MIKKITISPTNTRAIKAVQLIQEQKHKLQRLMAQDKPLSSLSIKSKSK